MYSKNETPIIRGSLMYYDSQYSADLGAQVQEVLEMYGFFPPEKIYADSLTRGRYIYYRDGMKDLFPNAYSRKGIFGISMASGDSKKVTDYWKFDWYFTFYKNKKIISNPEFTPWNVLSLDTTYGRMQDDSLCKQYFSCIRALISLIRPFYAKIDDVSNSVILLDEAKEECFKPDYVQQIYWGNYWGPDHCATYGMDNILQCPVATVEKISDGVYFTLTDSVFDATSRRCNKQREKIKRFLGV